MIFKKSRYRKATIYKVEDKQVMDFRLFINVPSKNSREFKLDTHRLDIWASNAYGDPEKFWMIADRLEEENLFDTEIHDEVSLIPEEEASYGTYK